MKFTKPKWEKLWNKKGTDSFFAITGGRKNEELLNNINNQVFHEMNFRPDDIVLDIGCGGGILVNQISNHVCKAVGTDLSISMLLHACRNKNTMYAHCDMKQLPFKNNFFTKIICISVLMYLPEDSLEVFFAELDRVITNNGTVFLGQLINKNNTKKLLSFKGFHRPKGINDIKEIFRKKVAFVTEMLTTHDPTDIEKLSSKYGFKTEIIKGLAPQSIYKENYCHFSTVLNKA